MSNKTKNSGCGKCISYFHDYTTKAGKPKHICRHKDNVKTKFDPIEGTVGYYENEKACFEWNKEGLCPRFSKKGV